MMLFAPMMTTPLLSSWFDIPLSPPDDRMARSFTSSSARCSFSASAAQRAADQGSFFTP
jgi:hypothetical protein